MGRDAICAFFASNPLSNTNFVGPTPGFWTAISIHGDAAEFYLECLFPAESLTVGPPAFALGDCPESPRKIAVLENGQQSRSAAVPVKHAIHAPN